MLKIETSVLNDAIQARGSANPLDKVIIKYFWQGGGETEVDCLRLGSPDINIITDYGVTSKKDTKTSTWTEYFMFRISIHCPNYLYQIQYHYVNDFDLTDSFKSHHAILQKLEEYIEKRGIML